MDLFSSLFSYLVFAICFLLTGEKKPADWPKLIGSISGCVKADLVTIGKKRGLREDVLRDLNKNTVLDVIRMNERVKWLDAESGEP